MRRITQLGVSTVLLVLVGLLLQTSSAQADIRQTSLDQEGVLEPAANAVILSGRLNCTFGETFTVRFTISQASSGATAAGGASGVCAGRALPWGAMTYSDIESSMESGRALVWLHVSTFLDLKRTDFEQGCTHVVLAAPPS